MNAEQGWYARTMGRGIISAFSNRRRGRTRTVECARGKVLWVESETPGMMWLRIEHGSGRDRRVEQIHVTLDEALSIRRLGAMTAESVAEMSEQRR